MKQTITHVSDISTIINLTSSKCRVTTDHWPIDKISLIQMKDGSYSIGIHIKYKQSDHSLRDETCKILLDENNVPYLELGGEFDFTTENCVEHITSFPYGDLPGHHHIVMGDDISRVFEFTGECLDESKINDYFIKCSKNPDFRNYSATNRSRYSEDTGLTQKSLAILFKYIEEPSNQKTIYKCYAHDIPIDLAEQEHLLTKPQDQPQ